METPSVNPPGRQSRRCGESSFSLPFPPSERATALAVVKARGLDNSCDPIAEKKSGSGQENGDKSCGQESVHVAESHCRWGPSPLLRVRRLGLAGCSWPDCD